MLDIFENPNSIIFSARVIPRSSKSEIIGEIDGDLKVKLTSPLVDGKANKELKKLLSKRLAVPKSDIDILSGTASKTKRIKVIATKPGDLVSILQAQN